MSISQKKNEDKIFAPRDLVYAKLIDNLRLEIKHYQGQKPEEIRALKTECIRQFEKFNKVRRVKQFFSLYALCSEKYLLDKAVQRDYVNSDDRDCFVDGNGRLAKIVLHVRKDEIREYKHHSIMKKLQIEMHFISSFKDPRMYSGVCYSRGREEPSKVVPFTRKSVTIFKKLFKILGRYSFGDII